MIDFLHHGLGGADIALAVNRLAVGAFFAISGWHKLANKERHAMLVQTLKGDKIPFVPFNAWFVPSVELFAGTFLALGVFSVIAALLLGAICLVADCTDGAKRVREYRPIDKADALDDFLYLPETLLGVMLVVTILAGPGSFTIHTH